jgi:hypothetical protein
MATKKQIAESLAGVPLFSRCSKKDLRIIARHAEVVELAADADVVTQGQDGESFFLILYGKVKAA